MQPTVVNNKELKLKSYPKEGRVRKEHIKIHETKLNLDSVAKAGDVAVCNHWVSVDPYVHWFFRDQAKHGLYVDSLNLNETIPCFMVGKVVKSANDEFKEGDMVTGHYGVSEYSIVAASALRKIDTTWAKPYDYLGLLGMPGMTAWVGLELIGPDLTPGMPGMTAWARKKVFVSSAMGGVGLIVGQLAKIKGCHVVGSVDREEQVKMVKETFGFDDAFNSTTEEDWDQALTRCFPNGIDIYFDNVGGRMLESVLNHINMNARILIFGMISEYNKGEWRKQYGVRNLLNLVGKHAKMEGILFDYKDMHANKEFLFDKYIDRKDKFLEEMRGYMGKIKYKEDVKKGIEKFPDALDLLLSGASTGKVLLSLNNA